MNKFWTIQFVIVAVLSVVLANVAFAAENNLQSANTASTRLGSTMNVAKQQATMQARTTAPRGQLGYYMSREKQQATAKAKLNVKQRIEQLKTDLVFA